MDKYRKIDALIAEHVFGWKIKDYGESCFYYKAPKGECGPDCVDHEHIVLEYSTQIQDAWLIIERLKENYNFKIERTAKSRVSSPGYITMDLLYTVTFIKDGGDRKNLQEGKAWEFESAPRAICIAALKALGVKYE